jgi:penicillin-binding protein 2
LIGREDEVRQFRDRVVLYYVATAVFLLLIALRLFFLQIVSGEELRRFSESNRLKKERLFPTRGVIYDRNGKVIVDNRAAFDVILLAQYYPFDEKTDARLAKALGMTPAELEKKIAKVRKTPTFHPVLLKTDVSKDVLAAIETDKAGFPGIDIETVVQRRYPQGDFASQLLGYIGEVDNTDIKRAKKAGLLMGDYIGRSGIERQYDEYLRGVNGVGYVEVDAMGRRKLANPDSAKLLGYVTQTDPVAGRDLHLTIDADLERAATDAFRSRGFRGSVVALDPRTGEVLALVNEPSYDPSLISTREIDSRVWVTLSQNKERPLRNRAIQDHYPPGSTFKIFMALAGLTEGVIKEETTVECPGHMQFGNRRFHCWKRHGTVDLRKSIRESCDVYYYNVGIQLGIDRLAKYARDFGLGSQTGIFLPNEQKGIIPDSEWKLKTYNQPWHPGETVSVSIGQGYVATTPLQLVNAFAAVGNGGFLYRPYVVKKIGSSQELSEVERKPELLRKINLSPEVMNLVKEGLFEVVNRPGGTAVRSYSPLTEISGKTGTSQVRATIKKKCELLDVEDRHHGWFVGYAPRENPEIAVVAIAEHSCHGSAPGPVVKEVIEAYMNKKNALPEVMGPEPLQIVSNEAAGDRVPGAARGPQSKTVPKKPNPLPARPNLGSEEDE